MIGAAVLGPVGRPESAAGHQGSEDDALQQTFEGVHGLSKPDRYGGNSLALVKHLG